MEPPDSGTDAWTVARLLAWTRDHLKRSGVESPRLCAELLLAHAMKCQRIQLYTQHDTVPGKDVLHTFRESVKQAAVGRPIAYLTGTKEFFSLSFEVAPDVLIPRPETEVLVERTIELVRHSAGALSSVLDLGTGSGCIVVSLARHLPDTRLFASDVSKPALQVARRNAQRHGVSQRIEFRVGDLFAAWAAQTTESGEPAAAPSRFDVVVCNPPYVAEDAVASLPIDVREHEPRVALLAGPDGLSVLRRVISDAPGWLSHGGHLLLEVGFDQAVAVRGLLDESVWDAIVTYRDELKHERVVHARLRDEQPTRTT
jgi:release factor glutamine methyltransferase